MEVSVYNFKNYRDFLKAFYQDKKKLNPRYSYAVFAQKAGLASPNYLKRVVDGTRKITHNNIRNFITGLSLSKRETDFFEKLVFFNQSEQKEAKEFYFGELSKLSNKNDHSAFKIDADYYEYLSNWFYVAIHEMVHLRDFEEDPKWITSHLKHKVTKPQVKRALELLQKMGLLKRDSIGKLKQTHPQLQYLKEVKNLAIQKFHKQMMELAKISIDKDNVSEREPSSVTLCVKEGEYVAIKKRIEEFCEEINTKFSCLPREGAAVLQINFQLFSLTRGTPRRII